MSETSANERYAEEHDWRERVASTLETIAERLVEPDRALVSRVAHLEELLKEFVGVMENPDSTNDEWASLLADVRQALGLDASV